MLLRAHVDDVPVVPHRPAVAGAERRADHRRCSAIMGFAGIGLNISTSMIAAIAHRHRHRRHHPLLQRVQRPDPRDRRCRAGDRRRWCARWAGRSCSPRSRWPPGFLIVCLSNFQPIQQFGVLASMTMVVALFADLLIMPALVMTRRSSPCGICCSSSSGRRRTSRSRCSPACARSRRKIVVLMARLHVGAAGHVHRAARRAEGGDVRPARGRVDVRRRRRRGADPQPGARRR